MTVSKRDIQILIGFIGVAAAALVYFFVFKPNMEKKVALEEQNAVLTERVDTLSTYEADYDTYVNEIGNMTDEINSIYAKFPSNVQAEDVIIEMIDIENQTESEPLAVAYGDAVELYSPIASSADRIIEEAVSKEREYYPEVDGWEQNEDEGFFASLVNFFSNDSDDIIIEEASSEEVVEEETTEMDGDVVEGEQAPIAEATPLLDESGNPVLDENGNPVMGSGIFLMEEPITYTLDFTTSQMKLAVSHIVNNTDRTVIKNIILAFDPTTGRLAGNMEIGKYYITGTGTTYEQPTFDGVSRGTDNLFSTVEKKND